MKLRQNVLVFAIAAATAQTALSAMTLEEVVVTAQKRAQSLQDVPITVSAVGESMIQDAGLQDIGDIQKLVPSLHILTSGLPSRTSIRIRGIGTNPSDPSLEPSVGVFVDGVFMPRSVFGLSDLVDVERVEVLNGPQGTLYGKNTNAGVISVTTKGMPDGLEGFVELTGGSDNQSDGSFSVSNLITDDLGFRLGGMVRTRDEIMDDHNSNAEYNEIDKQSYRGQLYWNPTDALSVRTIGYYSKSEGTTGVSEVQYTTDTVAGFAFMTGQDITDQLDYDPTNFTVSLDYRPESELEVKGASIQLDYAFDSGMTLTSITAFQEWELDGFGTDVDNTSLDALSTQTYNQEDAFGQELRLTSPGGETIDWLVGLYYFDSDLTIGDKDKAFAIWGQDFAPFLQLAGHTFNHHATFGTESISTFGQATWNFAESTSITAGLRYASEEKDFTTFVDAFDATGTALSDGGIIDTFALNVTFSGLISTNGQPINLADDLKESDVTGMISINHFIGDAMIYASVATGSKSGGFNGNFGSIPLAAREYDPETSTNYEIGAKIDGLLDGRARVNMSLFYTTFDDFQTTIYDASLAAFLTSNANEQVTSGIDIDGTLLATENLTLTASFEYLDAEFKDHEGAACHPTAKGATQVSATGYSCDLGGEVVDFGPDWSGSLTANYVLPLDGGSEFYAFAGYNFKTSHFTSTDRNPKTKEKPENLDARFGWRNDNWDIAVWGKNLTDDDYTVAYSENTFTGSIFPALGLTQRQTYARWLVDPKSYGITARYSF